MLRWIVPVALGAFGALGLAWLFRTKQGARARRQLTKHGQLMQKQGKRTLDQVGRQVQGSTQELLHNSHRLMETVTR
jgi:polyhydroxyalkanoate synthesis regulator phasin